MSLKSLWLALILIALLSVGSFLWSSRDRSLDQFSRATAQLPYTLDPARSLSEGGNAIVNAMYDGLVGVDDHGRITGNLAERWTVLGGKEYTFVIRRGVRFEDGTLLTPQHVVTSLQRAFLSHAISRAVLPELAEIRSDSDSIRLVLTRPTNLLPILASPTMRISLVKANGEILGTGLYGKSRRTQIESYPAICLERKSHYHRGNGGPHFLRFVELHESEIPKAFESGLIDDTSLYPGYSGPVPVGGKEIFTESHDTWVFGVNAVRSLNTRFIRKSLADAFPFETFRRRFIAHHRPSTGFIPPGIAGHNPAIAPLMGSAGNQRIHTNRLTLLVPSEILNSDEMCSFLQSELRGICDIECRATPFEELLRRMQEGDYDVALFSMTLDYPLDEYFAYVFDVSSSWHPAKLPSTTLPVIIDKIRANRGGGLQKEMGRLNDYLRKEYLVWDLSYPQQRTIIRASIANWKIGWAGPAYADYLPLRIRGR